MTSGNEPAPETQVEENESVEWKGTSHYVLGHV